MSKFNTVSIALSNGKNWRVAKAIMDFKSDLYSKAVSQAQIKSQYTMTASQAGEARTPELKYQRQLMGILAEIYVQEYLREIVEHHKLTDSWDVIRYDDVRTDGFKSPEGEYDMVIISKDKSKVYKIESRSSIAYNRSFKRGLEEFDIIGPYSSIAKSAESYADYYLRPLYEFTSYQSQVYRPLNFENYLQNSQVNLYIVAGCTKKQMIEEGYSKSMGQGSTRYHVIEITKTFDAIGFYNVLFHPVH
jgi:hypothetical protein